jgi:AraC-like DNA-binding protein
VKLLLLIALVLGVKGVPFTPMDVERLPDLNIPREAHGVALAGGEFTVFGGHTTGFVSTPTAEYYRRGKWHTVNMLYPHDAGFCTQLSSGDVLLGGGYSETFGIGQTWGVEVYHPATHSFSYLPILNHKRTHATALEMSDGSILVSGNWYSTDALERYTSGGLFEQVKAVTSPRDLPFVLQVSPDDAYVFGWADNYGNPLPDGWVDRLNGDPFQEPLLQEWATENLHLPNPPEQYRTGEFSYLIPVWKDGEQALLQLKEGRFSVLETALPLPQESPWGAIEWASGLQVEPESATAWKQGWDTDGRLYLLRISYGETPAGVEVFYSAPLEDLPHKARCLALPGGRYLMTGGAVNDAYNTRGTVLLCYTQPRKAVAGWNWRVMLAILAALLLLLPLWFFGRTKRSGVAPKPARTVAPDLQTRIVELMEKECLYRKKDLHISDLATRLNTNSTYISACLNGQIKMSFPHFVNGYRIRYAQELMRKDPSKPLSEISEEAGFSNESSFFRAFKAETGQTPTEWKQ